MQLQMCYNFVGFRYSPPLSYAKPGCIWDGEGLPSLDELLAPRLLEVINMLDAPSS